MAAIALLAAMLVAGSTPGSADVATSTVVLHRVNAGGPAVADTPGWVEDSGGSQSAYVNAGSSTTTVGDAIDLNDLSVPPGTLEALFQSERWDPSASLGGSLVEDLMTPLIAMIFGEPDFSALTFEINESVFRYGSFINALVSFVLIAAAVFFFMGRPVNALIARSRSEPPAEPTTQKCPQCLSEIPLEASRCAFCAQPVPAA